MKVLGVFAPERPVRQPRETLCIREVKAEFLTLGGAVILVVCAVITSAVFLAAQFRFFTDSQFLILSALTIAAWLYFFDSLSERLQLVDHSIEYRSLFSRRRLVPLVDLEGLLLIYEGFNMERGLETLEIRCRGKKPDRIPLGPCWQRNKLEAFLKSVEQALQDPHLCEEVR
ncbi:MAG: hypothetical protein ABIB04_04705 [Patescibacteria group bacterium]